MSVVSRNWSRRLAFVALWGGTWSCGTDETIEVPVPAECLRESQPPELLGAEPVVVEPDVVEPVEPMGSDGAELRLRFSEAPGFFTDALELRLESSHSRAEIFFTLDGSEPNPSVALASRCAKFRGAGLTAQTFRYTG